MGRLVGSGLEQVRQAGKGREGIRSPIRSVGAIRPYGDGDPIVRPLVSLEADGGATQTV